MRPPFDLAAVEAATAPNVALGHRILQTHRYAQDDDAHVGTLLDMLDPPPNAMILDAGCGIGEVARLMSARRPDLFFVLMNVSRLQLSMCPVGAQYLHALDDCHATLLNDGTMDAAMFSSSLCQMDIAVALEEAHRVLKNGGVLLINDMVRDGGHAEEMEQKLGARVIAEADLIASIESAGFEIDTVSHPAADDAAFRGLLKLDNMEHLLEGVAPIIIRAIARKEAV